MFRFKIMFSRSFRTFRPLVSLLDSSVLLTPTPFHADLRNSLRSFVAKHVEPQALEHNRKEQLNVSLLRSLGAQGLFGLTVPDKEGGLSTGNDQHDLISVIIAHEELSYSDPAFCLAYLAHSILFVHNLHVNASESLKSRYLSKVLSGEWIGGMCMSEPEAGTDVLAMKTKATKQPDRSYEISGTKMWITNGCLDDNTTGDIFLVYAKTFSTPKPSISLFLVEKTAPGFQLGQKISDKCGMRASCTAELVFDACRVPEDHLIGAEGQGLVPMMKNLEIERIALAAMALGIARRSLEVMISYANTRKTFGKTIGNFGQIQQLIAESFADYQAARAYVYSTAVNSGRSEGRADSDGVKLVATKVAKEVADRAIQTLGGYGYVGEYVVERLWRDAKLLEIGGGTLQAHQKNIAKDLLATD
jgi:isovaleryl-CoA dehydrogenase